MIDKLIAACAILAAIAALIFAGYKFGQKSVIVHHEVSPLSMASCPEPTPLGGDDFGWTTQKVMEQGKQYRKCREACLAK